MKKIKFLSLISILVLFSFTIGREFFNTASARQGFTIFPAKLSLTVDKGQVYNGVISVTNAGDGRVLVITDVQDVLPTPGGSGFNYLPKAPGITSLVEWIKINEKPFELNPDEKKDVSFSITVPSDASPGSRFAVLFFATGSSGGGQLNVSARAGSVILLTVPGDVKQTGEVKNFILSKFIWNNRPTGFKFDFLNTGTVYFEPKGLITITNIFGKKVVDIPVAGQVVLPTGMKSIGATWETPGYLFGVYKAHLAVSVTGGGEIATKDATFFAVPLYPSLGALGILLILIVVLWYIKRNFKFAIVKKESDKKESEPPQNPENKNL